MTSAVLDLYDLALLINYERTSFEPRFRYAKLREVFNDTVPKTIQLLPNDMWFTSKTPTKVGYVFDKYARDPNDTKPDMPDNLLPEMPHINPPLTLTPRERETIFYQARAHDACFGAVFIMQELFDLLPASISKFRVRLASGKDFYADRSERFIYEGWLRRPKVMLYSTVLMHNAPGRLNASRAGQQRRGAGYISGEAPSMIHAALAYYDPQKDLDFYKPDAILDLSSMQFGELGRGLKGKSLFVLESFEQYKARMLTFSDGMDPATIKVSERTSAPQDREVREFQRSVAKRVKERWDKRETEPWCGHCGAPAKQRCGKCKKSYFCNEEHSAAAWPMHKRICQ